MVLRVCAVVQEGNSAAGGVLAVHGFLVVTAQTRASEVDEECSQAVDARECAWGRGSSVGGECEEYL